MVSLTAPSSSSLSSYSSSSSSSSSCNSPSKLIAVAVVLVRLLVAGTLLSASSAQSSAGQECNWDIQCEELYQPGSVCLDTGMCSNRFFQGCLHQYYNIDEGEQSVESAQSALLAANKNDNRQKSVTKRACNSNDAAAAAATTTATATATDDEPMCETFPLKYTEIRIHNSNWESSMFYAWILQIFLSEFLQVPATVGLTADDSVAGSFYNLEPTLAYSSVAYPFEHLLTANANEGRCDLLSSEDDDEACVHVLPEVWIGQHKKWNRYLSEGHIDQVNGDGQVGKISWYIPARTARRYPSMTSYHGMSGDDHRETLAGIFDRPTTWGDYCALVSLDGCATADGVAQRAAVTAEDELLYFSEGLFTGHFRQTDANNCTASPETCTGHIVGPPCSWSTFLDSQLVHNDIALESNGPLPENDGYSYGHMIQIWRAANATQSDVIMWWWTPDPTTEEFRGTDYQFQSVLLPEPTNECRQSRIQSEDRCNLDPTVRQGDANGSCDNEVNSLQTVIASSLRDLTYSTPQVERSPGYQAVLNLKVSHLAMNDMLQKFVTGGRTGYAAREAVCEWVIDHQDVLESYIPRGFPRTFQDDTSYSIPLLYIAMTVAVFAVLYVLVMAVIVYGYSGTKVFLYAQVPFIFMVLFGLLLVAIGSIFFALEPSDGVCTSQAWLVTVGYTLELVPLLVKVAAINRLMAASQKMKRIQISMPSLFCTVASVVLLVLVFMTLWTVLDAPERTEGQYLTEQDEHITIVTTVSCGSGSDVWWEWIVLIWNGILVVCATALAFQSRTMIKQEFNDSQSLGAMIYSHFVFAVLRVVLFNLGGGEGDGSSLENGPAIEPATLAAASSFLMSLDVITAVTIYILPKIVSAHKAPSLHDLTASSGQGSSTFHNQQHKQGVATSGGKLPVIEPALSLSLSGAAAASMATAGNRRSSLTAAASRSSFRSSRSGSSEKRPPAWSRNASKSIANAKQGNANAYDNTTMAMDGEDINHGGDQTQRSGSGHRIGMDGVMIPLHLDGVDAEDDEDAESTSNHSSDTPDMGGPRFALTPLAVRKAATTSTSGGGAKKAGSNSFSLWKLKQDPNSIPVVPPKMSFLSIASIDDIEEGSESRHADSFNQEVLERHNLAENDGKGTENNQHTGGTSVETVTVSTCYS